MHTTTCQQCGTCCRKGGPILHEADLDLLSHILLSNVLTLRKAELVHDPVQNCVLPLEEEVIKIAGTGEKDYPWHCILHTNTGCALHPLRPAQCKALYCQNTAALKAQYTHKRITRKDVLCADLYALATAHEEQCSLMALVNLAKKIKETTPDHGQAAKDKKPLQGADVEEILEYVRYDAAFRQLCTEKGAAPAELLPLLFGRPVPHFLQSLGLLVRKKSTGDDLALYNLQASPYFAKTTSE